MTRVLWLSDTIRVEFRQDAIVPEGAVFVMREPTGILHSSQHKVASIMVLSRVNLDDVDIIAYVGRFFQREHKAFPKWSLSEIWGAGWTMLTPVDSHDESPPEHPNCRCVLPLPEAPDYATACDLTFGSTSPLIDEFKD